MLGEKWLSSARLIVFEPVVADPVPEQCSGRSAKSSALAYRIVFLSCTCQSGARHVEGESSAPTSRVQSLGCVARAVLGI